MKIRIPLVPIEFEMTARRRTEPIRFRVRTLMIVVALVALVVYLMLPLSAADQRLMDLYEQLGDQQIHLATPDLTKERVISMIGPPSRIGIPTTPKTCIDHTWVAHFDRPMSYQEFELNLAIDPDTDLVAAWGLHKTEYQGLELILFRIEQLMRRIGL
jgi:hypothetical protein